MKVPTTESIFLRIFIELSKAFVFFDHEILLNKLNYHGTKGKNINWFKSYLTNRKQYTDDANRKEKK